MVQLELTIKPETERLMREFISAFSLSQKQIVEGVLTEPEAEETSTKKKPAKKKPAKKAEEPADEATEMELTLEDLRNAVTTAKPEIGVKGLMKVIAEYDVQKASDIPKADWPGFIAKLAAAAAE